MLTVQDLIEGLPIKDSTCKSTDDLYSTVQKIVRNRLNGIVAIEEGQAVGILTDYDVMKAIVDNHGHVEHLIVSDIMSKNIKTCSPNTSLDKALQILGAYKIRHLVVTENRNYRALVSIKNILERIHLDEELELKVLRDVVLATRATLVS